MRVNKLSLDDMTDSGYNMQYNTIQYNTIQYFIDTPVVGLFSDIISNILIMWIHAKLTRSRDGENFHAHGLQSYA